MSDDAILAGDFRVLKMDGMFHVVFRPESDPEWFRIIASFYTYERAYSYCDVERLMFYDSESDTADEERNGLRAPPVGEVPAHQAQVDGITEVIRNVYEGGEHVKPLPYEPPRDQPEDKEKPEDYQARIFEQAVADIAREVDAPTCSSCGKPRSIGSAAQCRSCYTSRDLTDTASAASALSPDEPLTDKQSAVLDVLARGAKPNGLVSLPLSRIADDAKVPHGSISFLLESLERKRLMEVVERGRAGQTTIYRVLEQAPTQ